MRINLRPHTDILSFWHSIELPCWQDIWLRPGLCWTLSGADGFLWCSGTGQGRGWGGGKGARLAGHLLQSRPGQSWLVETSRPKARHLLPAKNDKCRSISNWVRRCLILGCCWRFEFRFERRDCWCCACSLDLPEGTRPTWTSSGAWTPGCPR